MNIIDIIEKCAKRLNDYYGVVHWEDIAEQYRETYREETRQVLKELGLTDHQIEALGKEGTRLTVVYKEGRLPEIFDVVKLTNGNHSAVQKDGKQIQQDMLYQGFVQEVKG